MFENVIDKDHFDFRIRFRSIHNEKLLCQRQTQYQVLHKNQVRLSLLKYLVLLLMIFPLHFEKANIIVKQT